MSDGDRLRNYALGAIVGLSLAGAVGYTFWTDATQLEEQASFQAQEHSAKYADPAYVAVECEAADVPATGQEQCIEAESEAAREAQRGEYDLEAQQTMAIWTRVMGKAAIIGMAVGIVGLFLIFTTFAETRKAASSSAKTLRAFIAKERAILTVKGGSRSYDVRAFKTGVTVTLANVGNSPTSIQKVEWEYLKFDEWPDFFRNIKYTKRVIPPKDEGPSPCLYMEEDLKPNQAIRLAAIIHYKTLELETFKCHVTLNIKNEGGRFEIGTTTLKGRPYDT